MQQPGREPASTTSIGFVVAAAVRTVQRLLQRGKLRRERSGFLPRLINHKIKVTRAILLENSPCLPHGLLVRCTDPLQLPLSKLLRHGRRRLPPPCDTQHGRRHRHQSRDGSQKTAGRPFRRQCRRSRWRHDLEP